MPVNPPYAGNPWDKQEGENPMWYSRFNTYLSLGPERTVKKAMETLNLNTGASRYWQQKCAEDRWVERAGMYDESVSVEIRSATEVERREMHLRHAEQATKALDMATQIIEHVVTLIGDGALRTVSLVPRTITQETERGPVKVRSEGLLPLIPALASAVKTLQQAERMARGDSESTTSVQVSGAPGGQPIQVASTMTEEQQNDLLARLDALAATKFGVEAEVTPDVTDSDPAHMG